jgi:hypothetical protein
MLINITNLRFFNATRVIVDMTERRPALRGMLFSPGGRVTATDGHRLVRTVCCDYNGPDVLIKILGKAAFPKAATRVEIDIIAKTLNLINGHGARIDTRGIEILKDPYPGVRRIERTIHADRSPSTIIFNPALLADIQKAGNWPFFRLNFGATDRENVRFTPLADFADETFYGLFAPCVGK